MAMSHKQHFDFEVPPWRQFESGPQTHTPYRTLCLSLNPVAHWPMDDPPGSTVMTDIIDGHDGTYYGASPYFSLGKPGISASSRSCAYFGADITDPYNPANSNAVVANPIDPTQPWTFCHWYNAESWDHFSANQAGIVGLTTATTGPSVTFADRPCVNTGWRYGAQREARIVGGGIDSYHIGEWHVTGIKLKPAGEWGFLALSWDGSLVKMWGDGQPMGQLDPSVWESDVNAWLSAMQGIRIRWHHVWHSEDYWPHTFNGHIDEVSIFDRVLTDAELLSLYQTGKGMP